MKTMTRILGVAAVAVLAVALAGPASATCNADSIISTVAAPSATNTNKSFIFGEAFAASPYFGQSGFGNTWAYGIAAGDPASPPLSANAQVSFWALGAGDPAVGVGFDNGAYDMVGAGLYFYGYGVGEGGNPNYSFFYAATIEGSWDGGATDGCPGDGAGNACMCLLITDEENGAGTFAITGGFADANVNTFMNREGTTDGGAIENNAPIVLLPIPGPTIVGSNRDGTTNDVTFTINVPSAAIASDYTQDAALGCDCSPVGYKVYQSVVGRGGMPPMGRDLASWTEMPQADGMAQPALGTPLGTEVSLTSGCGGSDSDVYLTTQLIFDSGFATSTVSANSTRVECGPSLANPSDTRPGRPDRPGQDRPRGRRR